MRNELFRIFDFSMPGYSLLLFTGFLFATAAGAAWARRVGQDPDVIVDLGLATLLLGIIGGKLLHVVADGYFWDYVNLCVDPSKVDWKVDKDLCPTRYGGVWDAAKKVCHPVNKDCFAWAKFWNPGYAYYGGFIASAAGAWYLLKWDRFPFWKAADMAGFTIPIGLAFGRMGCLLAGCCFGGQSDSALALSFPPGSPASDAQFKLGLLKTSRMWSLPVHPTQIYEAALAVAIAAICLLWVHGRKKYDGQVFVVFMGLYAAGRFGLEFLRADDRGAALGLSTSQLIGVVLAGLALYLHRRLSARAAAA
jgi:phosphatidylglycerol---prolipoprotein diacylglyceryl transferase